MAEGAAQGLRLVSAPDHRLQGQLRFLQAFPAYTTTGTASDLTLWYHGGRGAASLTLHAVPGGVTAYGDASIARHVLHAGAGPLLPPADLPAHPAAHRWLHGTYGGIRPVQFAAAFEGMAWTILGQQITLSFAAQLKDRLARHYGPEVAGPAGPVWVFPGPDGLARASVEDLRRLQLSRQKAEALLGLARALTSGGWTPEQAFGQPTAEAVAELCRFRGVGRWTAEYILLRVAGYPDVLPAGDVGLQRAWARLNGLPGRCDEQALQEAGLAWAGWRSDFAFSLWLDNWAARERAAGPAARGRPLGPAVPPCPLGRADPTAGNANARSAIGSSVTSPSLRRGRRSRWDRRCEPIAASAPSITAGARGYAPAGA